MEKMSSSKLVPGTKTFGDQYFRVSPAEKTATEATSGQEVAKFPFQSPTAPTN